MTKAGTKIASKTSPAKKAVAKSHKQAKESKTASAPIRLPSPHSRCWLWFNFIPSDLAPLLTRSAGAVVVRGETAGLEGCFQFHWFVSLWHSDCMS